MRGRFAEKRMPNTPTGSPELFVDQPPEFRIDQNGIGHVRVFSGEQEFSFRCTPHVLLAGSSAAMRAYVEWDEGRIDPVPIDKG